MDQNVIYRPTEPVAGASLQKCRISRATPDLPQSQNLHLSSIRVIDAYTKVWEAF